MPGFESQVIPRISSYSLNKKQQHFSNTILVVTCPKLSRHYWRDKLGTRKMVAHFDGDDLWELAELYVDLFPPTCCANPLTDLDEV